MPPTNNQEPITNNQQPPTNNQQQTTNNKQQTTNILELSFVSQEPITYLLYTQILHKRETKLSHQAHIAKE